ncbi:MAG: DUF3769 domain-containing protein [Thermostichales cyanobacterium DRC_bins_46]
MGWLGRIAIWSLIWQLGQPVLATTQQPIPIAQAIRDPGNELILRADEQTFDQRQQVFLARGNVTLAFRRARLQAEEVRLEVDRRVLTARGNVLLRVGEQFIRGQDLEYNLEEERGEFRQVEGEVFFASLEADVASLSSDPKPIQAGSRERSTPRLIRFRAERIRFDARSWVGENVQITNDPVEPPELAIQAPRVNLTLDERGSGLLTALGGQLALDQSLFLPLPGRLRLDQFRRGLPLTLRTDAGEPRRGLLLQANFEIFAEPDVSFVLSPQFFLARWLNNANSHGLADLIGLETSLQVRFAGGQLLSLLTQLDGLVWDQLGSRLRAQVVYSLPLPEGGRVNVFYSYRELFFNGLLGFQTVNNRLGISYTTPTFTLGDPELRFQAAASVEWIDALGERQINQDPDLALANAEPLQLAKLSLTADLNRRFPLWLAPVAEVDVSQLRFSRDPVQPGFWLVTGVSGSQFFYSNGGSQSYLVGRVGIEAVIGQLLADSFDYTGLNITYSNGLLTGSSPFLYDRITTREQLELGILQQVYGPVQVGAETTLDLQTGRSVDTTYSLGFQRRTYGITVKFSPSRQTGAIELRIDDLNLSN